MLMILAILSSFPQTVAPSAGDLGTLYGTVHFINTPSSEDIRRVTPDSLTTELIVRIKCSVDTYGHLINCSGDKTNDNKEALVSALSLSKFYRLPIIQKGFFALSPWVWLDIKFSKKKNGTSLLKGKCSPPYCVSEPLID